MKRRIKLALLRVMQRLGLFALARRLTRRGVRILAYHGVWLGAEGYAVKVFFLACILVAGLYGAVTSSRKILFVQAVPAALGLLTLFL